MKIDGSHDIPAVAKQNIRNSNKNQTTASFDAVLQNSIQHSGSHSEAVKSSSVQPSIGPASLKGLSSFSNPPELQATQRLLDNLEAYQQLLADPKADLRMIEPVVGQMALQAKNAGALLDRMPENHPLREILEESLENISQEVERYNAGYYVDD